MKPGKDPAAEFTAACGAELFYTDYGFGGNVFFFIRFDMKDGAFAKVLFGQGKFTVGITGAYLNAVDDYGGMWARIDC